jgi:hypothetical protein
MMTLTRPGTAQDDISLNTDTHIGTGPVMESRHIVAREGSELAETLRARGWRARSGWRSTTDTGDSIWYMRFEVPADGCV